MHILYGINKYTHKVIIVISIGINGGIMPNIPPHHATLLIMDHIL